MFLHYTLGVHPQSIDPIWIVHDRMKPCYFEPFRVISQGCNPRVQYTNPQNVPFCCSFSPSNIVWRRQLYPPLLNNPGSGQVTPKGKHSSWSSIGGNRSFVSRPRCKQFQRSVHGRHVPVLPVRRRFFFLRCRCRCSFWMEELGPKAQLRFFIWLKLSGGVESRGLFPLL